MPDFPRHRIGLLHELGARLLDRRKVGTPLDALARDLLAGFQDICMNTGLDRVLAELEGDVMDREADLVEKLRVADPDGGGPRNAKPAQLADCVVAALGLTLVDTTEPVTALDEVVRVEAAAAIAHVIDAALALPQMRDAIIAKGRELCDPKVHAAYDKIAAQLDNRGMTILKQLKIPLDAEHAVKHVLVDARRAVIGGAASTAIDRAKQVIERVDAEAAARIDAPITHRLTPREVTIDRVCSDRVPKVPAAVASAVLASIGELARIAWRAPEVTARPYAASQVFGVGEVIDHPKFGRGSVVALQPKRIEVEFADGKHVLVHAGK